MKNIESRERVGHRNNIVHVIYPEGNTKIRNRRQNSDTTTSPFDERPLSDFMNKAWEDEGMDYGEFG